MKIVLSGLIGLLCLFPLLAGCTGAPAETEASLGEEFLLAIGQEAQITGENLRISFEDVVGDSRCPLNVNCVWEGRASVLVRLTYDDVAYSIVLNEPGLTDHAVDTFLDYSITFHLEPYPVAAGNISKRDYRLQLTIGKQQQTSIATGDSEPEWQT